MISDADVGDAGSQQRNQVLRGEGERRQQPSKGDLVVQLQTTSDHHLVGDHLHHLVVHGVRNGERSCQDPDGGDQHRDWHHGRQSLSKRIDESLVSVQGDHHHREGRHVDGGHLKS